MGSDKTNINLRDYFAAKAMAAMVGTVWPTREDMGAITERSYIMSDMMVEKSQPLKPKDDVLRSALILMTGALADIERNTCEHEDTHRGGSIWEICDSCGKKWADDEGGKPDVIVEKKIVTDLRDFITKYTEPELPPHEVAKLERQRIEAVVRGKAILQTPANNSL